MNDLQKKLYGLLKEVDEICRRNDITYYLAGGAALGAIRGGGFLPWDDDVDLYITRENWNRLVKVMETQTPENRMFVCSENDPIYCNPVGRYVDCNSTMMMKSQVLSAKACGIMVEFFVFDAMPMGEKEKWDHRRYVKAYCELLSPYFVCNRNTITENIDFDMDLYQSCLRRIRSEGKDKVLGELFDKITATKEEESDSWCMFWGKRTLIYPKEYFDTPRMERFEEDYFPVPASQEGVSRIAFGDSWMYVPGVSGQIVHGIDCSMDVPFREYVNIYMPHIDVKRALESFERNKRIRADGILLRDKYMRELSRAHLAIASQRLKGTKDDARKLREKLEQGKLNEVGRALREFFFCHESSIVKSNRLIADVSDEYISLAADYLFIRGEYYRAGAFLSDRKLIKKPLSTDLNRSVEKHKILRNLSVAVYDEKDPAQVEAILDSHPEFHDMPDFMRARLWLLRMTASDSDDWEMLLNLAEEYEKKQPDDGEIIAYQACALHYLERQNEAEARYKEAISRTRNGYVWRDAAELAGMDAYRIIDGEITQRTVVSEDDSVDMDLLNDGDENTYSEDQGDESLLPDSEFRRNTLVGLLREIDQICRENGLTYSLTGDEADHLIENGNLPPQIIVLRIAMTPGDIERLIDLVNSGKSGFSDRVIEYIENNPFARGLSVRYVAKDTTQINIIEYGNHIFYGYHVRIEPIKREIDSKRNNLQMKLMNNIWKGCQKRLTAATTVKAAQATVIKGIAAIVGKKRLARAYQNMEKDYRFIDRWEDIKSISKVVCGRVMWNNYMAGTYTVDGVKRQRSWDVKAISGSDGAWMVSDQFYRQVVKKVSSHENTNINEICDNRPYDVTMTDDVKEYLDHAKIIRDKYIALTNPTLADLHEIGYAWNSYLVAKDIYLLKKEYNEKKIDEIRRAAESGDRDRFYRLIENYVSKAAYWNRKRSKFGHIANVRDTIMKSAEELCPSQINTDEYQLLRQTMEEGKTWIE